MSDRVTASRRSVLTATVAAVAVPATVGARSTLGDTQAETIRLESDLSGWQGVAPDAIAGEENPTLSLTPGEAYEIVWENADGVDHNLYVEDENGDAVANTETVGTEGETRSVTFTATESVSTYRCRIHTSMSGDVQVGEGTTTAGTTESGDDGGLYDTTEESDATTADGDTTTADAETTTADGTEGDSDAADDSGGMDDDSDGGGMPGFGVAAAVAGLVGALGLRRRRR